MKKILVVDDSALMRRVICDIINSDTRFKVEKTASDGKIALELLRVSSYDAVVLDVNMPNMGGLQLLKQLQIEKIPARVMMASTDTMEGAKTTLDALELGALDFVHKPNRAFDCKNQEFVDVLLRTLDIVANSKIPSFTKAFSMEEVKTSKKIIEMVRKRAGNIRGNKIVAISSSTGGPKALLSVIPRLPRDIGAPILLVQHMPIGFTKSFATRLDSLSDVTVKEAEDGEVLENGVAYVSKAGLHLRVSQVGSKSVVSYSDAPPRLGVKPCANYMYESLVNSRYDTILCVIMTGMGYDGTEGVSYLKATKKAHLITQDEASSVIYGMPGSAVGAGISDQIVTLDDIAQEIIMYVGVD